MGMLVLIETGAMPEVAGIFIVPELGKLGLSSLSIGIREVQSLLGSFQCGESVANIIDVQGFYWFETSKFRLSLFISFLTFNIVDK